MQKAMVSYRGADLTAWEEAGRWTVRFGAFEASSPYLDLALAEVFESGEGVHQLAARLLAELPSTGTFSPDEPIAA